LVKPCLEGQIQMKRRLAPIRGRMFQATFIGIDASGHRDTACRLRKLAQTSRVLRGLRDVSWHSQYAWVGISATSWRELPTVAEITSRALECECVALDFQTVSSSFAYHFYTSGQDVRSLVYGYDQEACWESVAGMPQPWEAAALTGAPVVSDRESAHSVTRMVKAVREFHRLPPSFEVCESFGPPWLFRRVPLLW
jgi:hypothetical protein